MKNDNIDTTEIRFSIKIFANAFVMSEIARKCRCILVGLTLAEMLRYLAYMCSADVEPFRNSSFILITNITEL